MPIKGPVPEKGPLHVTPSMRTFLCARCSRITPNAGNSRIAIPFAAATPPISRPSSTSWPCRSCQRSRGREVSPSSNTALAWVLRRLVCAARCHPNRPPAARPGRAREPPARLKGAQTCHEFTRTAGSAQAVVWAVRSRRQCAGRLLAAASRHTVVRPAAGLCAPPLPSQAQPMGPIDASVHETAYHLITAAPKVRSSLSTPPPDRAHALVSRA